MNNIMTIIFLRKDGAYSYYESQRDLQALINLEVGKYGDDYIGAYNLHVFVIDGKEYQLQSKLSYEEVWQLADEAAMGQSVDDVLGINAHNNPTWEDQMIIRLGWLSTIVSVSNDGKPESAMTLKDPYLGYATEYDKILTWLYSAYIMMHYSKKRSYSYLENYLGMIKKAISDYPEFDFSDFDKIITSLEQELPNYKKRSLASRLFKR